MSKKELTSEPASTFEMGACKLPIEGASAHWAVVRVATDRVIALYPPLAYVNALGEAEQGGGGKRDVAWFPKGKRYTGEDSQNYIHEKTDVVEEVKSAL